MFGLLIKCFRCLGGFGVCCFGVLFFDFVCFVIGVCITCCLVCFVWFCFVFVWWFCLLCGVAALFGVYLFDYFVLLECLSCWV